MKSIPWLIIAASSALFYSCCSTCNQDQNTVVSQKFIHKYGFDLSPEEWSERAGEGKIVTVLENGIKATEAYENGELHGTSTYTFPHSDVVEKICVYDQGVLLKEVLHDRRGIPMQEEAYEFDNRKIITLWDQNGAPLSVEEYDGDLLIEGTYYNSVGEIESVLQEGKGMRIKRDRSGKLILKDQFENGSLVRRNTFHPNEQIETICQYDGYVLNGEQVIFTPTGKLHMKANWDHGQLNGLKTAYREGSVISETPYLAGKKHGIERRYDEDGNLVSETSFSEDEKHGPTVVYNGKDIKNEWYFKGKGVSAQRFSMLENRSRMLAELSQEIELDIP